MSRIVDENSIACRNKIHNQPANEVKPFKTMLITTTENTHPQMQTKSRTVKECHQSLDTFFDHNPCTAANNDAKALLQISFQIIITYHKYTVVMLKRWHAQEAQYAAIVEKVCAHVLDPLTGKLSTAWRSWCMMALYRSQRTFVRQTFNRIYGSTKRSLHACHNVLADILHHSICSPDRIAAISAVHRNDSYLSDYAVSVKTFSVLITQLPLDVLIGVPKLVPIMRTILKMNETPPFEGEWQKWRSADGWDEICNPRILFRTACQECVEVAKRCVPFLII